jgi:replication initiation and membrane attachment protein DnaB
MEQKTEFREITKDPQRLRESVTEWLNSLKTQRLSTSQKTALQELISKHKAKQLPRQIQEVILSYSLQGQDRPDFSANDFTQMVAFIYARKRHGLITESEGISTITNHSTDITLIQRLC